MFVVVAVLFAGEGLVEIEAAWALLGLVAFFAVGSGQAGV
jgi:hypothetical protein